MLGVHVREGYELRDWPGIQITEFMGVWALCLRHTDLLRDLVKVQILFQ